MSVDRSTLLFFDASCLIAAAGSPSGGTGFLLSLCELELLRAAVSQPVMLEADRTLVAKFPPAVRTDFYLQLARIPILLVPAPSAAMREHYRGHVNPKDDHVLAAAIACGAPYLLVLDQPFQREVNQANLSIHAVSPGEFITEELPMHPDAARLRD